MTDEQRRAGEVNRKKGARAEIRAAKLMGATRTKSSGSGAREKGDMVAERDGFLIETKSTDRKSFSVTKEILGRIESQAAERDLDPMVTIHFTSPGQIVERDWVLLPVTALSKRFKRRK